MTSSGTGALEAAVANCLPAGTKAIALISGRFGERWKSLCKAFGVEVVSVTVPYGQANILNSRIGLNETVKRNDGMIIGLRRM